MDRAHTSVKISLLAFTLFSLSGCGAMGKLVGTAVRAPIDIARSTISYDESNKDPTLTNEEHSLYTAP